MLIILITVVAMIILAIVTFKYPMVSLAAYIMIAFIKAILLIKFSFFRIFDPTVLCAVWVLIAMAYSFVKSGGRLRDIISIPLCVFLLLAAVLLLGLAYTSAPNYGLQKSSRFATLTLIAFAAPVVFAHSLKDVKQIIWILFLVGIVFSVVVFIAPHAAVTRTSGRGAFLESSPLATASKIATASIIAFCFAIMAHTSKHLKIISLVVIPPMIIGIIITGSRGPLIGLVITWLVAILICRKGISKAWLPFITAVVVIAIIVPFAKLPIAVTSRISGLWRSGYQAKEIARSRTELFVWAASRSPERPILGHGTGAFAVDRGGQDAREYPHNIIIELLYEQGLVGALMGSLFLWLIFKRWRQGAGFVRLYGLDIEVFQMVHIVGLVFLFTFIQAMKSGDLAGNRLLFFCAGLVVAVFNLVRRSAEEISSESDSTADDWQQLEKVGFQDTQPSY